MKTVWMILAFALCWATGSALFSVIMDNPNWLFNGIKSFIDAAFAVGTWELLRDPVKQG